MDPLMRGLCLVKFCRAASAVKHCLPAPATPWSTHSNCWNFPFDLNSSKFGVKSWPWESCHEFPRDHESGHQCKTCDNSPRIKFVWPLWDFFRQNETKLYIFLMLFDGNNSSWKAKIWPDDGYCWEMPLCDPGKVKLFGSEQWVNLQSGTLCMRGASSDGNLRSEISAQRRGHTQGWSMI